MTTDPASSPATEPTLSPQTQASVQGLVRAKSDVEAWTKNLEQALADDLAATPPRLTQEEAAAIAKENGVEAPKAPAPEPDPKATEAEAGKAADHQQHASRK